MLCVISVTIGQVITMPVPMQSAAENAAEAFGILCNKCFPYVKLYGAVWGTKMRKALWHPVLDCHRAFILLPGKKKEQASEEACSLLVGEAGLEPARPQ